MRNVTMNILIAAGGSGGHIFPAIALARTLKRKSKNAEIRFVGSNKDLDKRIFEKEGFGFSLLSSNKLPYEFSWGILLFLLKLISDLVKAFGIVLFHRPDVIVGFGGYVACPITIAACFFRVPKILHEQNVVPGRANRFLFTMADRIAISFNETKELLGTDAAKAVFTGNPIRTEDFKDDKAKGLKRFGLDAKNFTILVVGGSQGAHVLNTAFIEALSRLDREIKSSLQVIHITGIKDYEWALGAYKKLGLEHRVNSFVDRIEEAYSASDLIVTRSGASAIFEIAFFGKPMMLIPYPFAMSHQAENAGVFSKKGAAITIDENALSAEVFKENITSLFKDRNRLKRLAECAKRLSVPDASDRLAEEVLAIAKK